MTREDWADPPAPVNRSDGNGEDREEAVAPERSSVGGGVIVKRMREGLFQPFPRGSFTHRRLGDEICSLELLYQSPMLVMSARSGDPVVHDQGNPAVLPAILTGSVGRADLTVLGLPVAHGPNLVL